jgi:ubiquitin carboxyl-terminal hydrolase 1
VCACVFNRYYLHAIILHVGLSLSSGHYVAFVKAPPRGCFPHQQPSVALPSLHRSSVESAAAGEDVAEGSIETPPVPSNGGRVTRRQSLRGQSPVVREGCDGDEMWYECDDDRIRPLTSADLDSRLSPDGAASPYLLLYHSATWSWSSVVEG